MALIATLHSPIVKATKTVWSYSFSRLQFILDIPLILSLESSLSFLLIWLRSPANPMSVWQICIACLVFVFSFLFLSFSFLFLSFPFLFFSASIHDEASQINCSIFHAIQMKVRDTLDWTQNPGLHICQWDWIEFILLSNQTYYKTTIIERFWPWGKNSHFNISE